MRMTTKGQYAIVALTNIKRKNPNGEANPVRIEEISKEEGLSQHYLEQLFRKLRNANIVRSIRGPGGGYVLKGNKISYKQVLDAVGEKVAVADSITNESTPGMEVVSKLKGIYSDLTKGLESATI